MMEIFADCEDICREMCRRLRFLSHEAGNINNKKIEEIRFRMF